MDTTYDLKNFSKTFYWKDSDKKGESSSISGRLPSWLQQPGLGRPKPILELH